MPRPADAPTTPSLDAGVTRLTVPAAHPHVLHRLVVDELGRREGTALWVDARNRASTYALYEVADERAHLLDRLRIARAFTAYQHYELVRRVVREADAETALVVLPRPAALYRDDDVPAGDARAMLRTALSTLAQLAAARDLAVLVTARENGPDDRLATLVADAVDHEVDCEATPMGPRFDAPGFETHGYWRWGYWQTTIPYWVDLAGAVETMPRPDTFAPTLAEAVRLADAEVA